MGEKGCLVILPTWHLYSRHQGSLTCRKSTTWGRRLYFPSDGRRAEDFFALKNPTSAGFEPQVTYNLLIRTVGVAHKQHTTSYFPMFFSISPFQARIQKSNHSNGSASYYTKYASFICIIYVMMFCMSHIFKQLYVSVCLCMYLCTAEFFQSDGHWTRQLPDY